MKDRHYTLTDETGDTLEVDTRTSRGSVFVTSGHGANVLLTRDQVTELRDYLTGWLGDQPTELPEDNRPTCCTGEDGSTCCPGPDNVVPLRPVDAGDQPQTILEEAQAAVYGDRQADYGHPREDMTRQAIIWTGLLHHKLADGAHLEPEDVARCMVGVKLARDVNAPKRDNRVDGAGYFLCLDRLETGR